MNGYRIAKERSFSLQTVEGIEPSVFFKKTLEVYNKTFSLDEDQKTTDKDIITDPDPEQFGYVVNNGTN